MNNWSWCNFPVLFTELAEREVNSKTCARPGVHKGRAVIRFRTDKLVLARTDDGRSVLAVLSEVDACGKLSSATNVQLPIPDASLRSVMLVDQLVCVIFLPTDCFASICLQDGELEILFSSPTFHDYDFQFTKAAGGEYVSTGLSAKFPDKTYWLAVQQLFEELDTHLPWSVRIVQDSVTVSF